MSTTKEKKKKMKGKKERPNIYEMCKYLGVNEGLMMHVLFTVKDRYYAQPSSEREKADAETPWFPASIKEIEDLVGFPVHKQRRYVALFRQMGLIDHQMLGFPSARYVKINFGKLRKTLDNIKLGPPKEKDEDD